MDIDIGAHNNLLDLHHDQFGIGSDVFLAAKHLLKVHDARAHGKDLKWTRSGWIHAVTRATIKVFTVHRTRAPGESGCSAVTVGEKRQSYKYD